MHRTFVTVGAAALMALTFGTSAHAATLQIQFTGLDLVFDGNTIVDAKSPLGGNGLPSEADPLASMDFFVDGRLVGSLSSNIYADVALFGVQHIPVNGGSVHVQGGGFDLLTSALGWGLALNVNDLTLFYTGGQLALSGASAATEIFAQNLPFGLELLMGQPVEVLFVLGTLMNVTDNGQWLTGFNGSGTGSIAGSAGTALPEPATLLMLGAGLLAVTARARRRVR